MKIKSLITYLLVMLFLLILNDNCATDNKIYVPTEKEEIYGTWINEEESPQKWIMYPNGMHKRYIYESDTSPSGKGTFELYKKWKDNKGNIWYVIVALDSTVRILL